MFWYVLPVLGLLATLAVRMVETAHVIARGGPPDPVVVWVDDALAVASLAGLIGIFMCRAVSGRQ